MVLDATEGGTRTLPAAFDRARMAQRPAGGARPGVFRRPFPTSSAGPTIALYAWLPRQFAEQRRAGHAVSPLRVVRSVARGTVPLRASAAPCRCWRSTSVDDDPGHRGAGPSAAWRPFWKCCDERPAPPHHADQWDQRYAELRAAGLREPDYGGPLRRHVADGDDRRLLGLRIDNSPAALRLWNFLLTEEDRLRQAQPRGKKLVGAMKDLGTVPVMAYCSAQPGGLLSRRRLVAALHHGGPHQLLAIADSLGIDESFCPVRAMLGAFVRRGPFPHPGPADVQRGRHLRRFLGHRPAAGRPGLPDPVVGDAASPAAGGRRAGVELPGGFVAPAMPGGPGAAPNWSGSAKPWRPTPASR